MAQKLKVYKISSVDLVGEGSCNDAHITLYKSKEGGKGIMEFSELKKSLTPEELACVEAEIAKAKTEPTCPDCGKPMSQCTCKADLKAKKDAAEGEVAKLKGEIETLKKSANLDGQSDEDILKSANLDPAVRAILERTIAKSKAAEAEVIKAKEAQETADFVAKAKEVSFVPESDTKVVELFKSIKGVDGAVDKVMDILKSVNTVIAKGATFNEFGSSNQGAASNTSSEAAWAAIEKAANDLVVKGQVTKAKSIQMVIEQNPALYKTYTDALRNE